MQILLLWFLCGTASADVADDWEHGKQAFNAGDYALALSYFEAARDAGLTGPAVHYNIAVSQFRLGRYGDSAKTFEHIAGTYPKMRGLAEYNLGLTAMKLDRRQDAEAHFLRAYELSPDDRKLRILAARRLRELEPDRRVVSRWAGTFGLRFGYDDNAALLDKSVLPAGSTTDSPMTDAFLSFSGPWTGQSGLRVEGSAYLVKYSDAGDFDQTELQGGVFYEWRPADWSLRIGIHAGTGSIGGTAFDRDAGGRLRAIRYLGDNALFDLRYAYDNVTEADSIFAGVAGDRQEIDARYLWYRDEHRFSLRYRHESNDRSDPAVSPQRNRFSLDYRLQPERGLGFEAGIDFRKSDYNELDLPRTEDLQIFHGAVTYLFGNDWLTSVEYSATSNDSSDEAYSYDRSVIMLGAAKYF